jgi:rhodanese-related sulfurtransferase
LEIGVEKMKQITARELEQKLQNGVLLNIIDVRETHEVAMGKIPTAVNIPLGIIEFKMPDLDKNKEYIIVCHSGGRSFQATRFLESYGFNVTNMDGGMMSWEGEVE